MTSSDNGVSAPRNAGRKRILSATLAGALAVAVPAASAAHATPDESVPVPEVKILESTVPVYDPMRGIAMGISGLYERTVANTGGRTAKIYASKDAYLGAYVVVLTTPEGEETAAWLAESGWIERADKEQLVLYVLEPGASGDWGTPEEELPYVETAVYHFADARENYYQPSESYYAVGYDAGGTALQQVVMQDPILFAAGAFVDASDIGSPFLDSLDTDFYATPDWDGNQVPSSEVPMPVWLVNSQGSPDADRVADHWKQANQTRSKGISYAGGKLYEQRAGTLYGYVADSSRVAVGLLENKNVRKDDSARRQLDNKIYDFLSSYTRYGGNVGGNTVGSRPDYDDLGVTRRTMVVDGRLREYLVYVPRKAKVAAARGADVPLVLTLHGSGMTMHMMFDYSRWWEVADREGFILVAPTSTNNGRATAWSTGSTSADFAFIDQVRDDVAARHNVDESRVYLNGQSNGSQMAQAIGRNLTYSKNYTAIGSTSFPATSNTFDGELLPFMTLWGEYDFWPWERTSPQVGGMLDYWIGRNDALGTPAAPAIEETTHRRTVWSWTDAAGTDVVRYGVTWGRGHSIIPEEMPVLWEWFESWRKNARGENVYVGP
jgi:poly(3-hydroxybutyrate) depolymerase